MAKKTTKKKAAKKARQQRTNVEHAKPEAKPPAKKARRGKSSQDRVVVRFKRSVNCPHHLTRLGRKPTKAEREKLDGGLVPQRRFNGGRQYTMTREELSRYCLKEKLDYVVERVIPAPAPPSRPGGGGSDPTPPENPDAGQSQTDPNAPADKQGAEPSPPEEPADPGPGDQVGADEQPPPVDPATA